MQTHTADPPPGIAGTPPLLQLAADGKTVRGARTSTVCSRTCSAFTRSIPA
ncbi:hypothetical protein JK359_29640 [Streptomyces actinomycinicus]|uniref:Uncharacterized protein n=1 Tax=Streptomyces actinomycinicus TaxID=1695166 RepID=A0A937ENB7_9ACTN|nr:hypothetical protein [Streptomyces actinomycinicus]MBL1086076.1 hypothetical protein [Streptomyces actinomycinicus]